MEVVGMHVCEHKVVDTPDDVRWETTHLLLIQGPPTCGEQAEGDNKDGITRTSGYTQVDYTDMHSSYEWQMDTHRWMDGQMDTQK